MDYECWVWQQCLGTAGKNHRYTGRDEGNSFALILGIIMGTYSTVFFSCPMVVDLPFQKIKSTKAKSKITQKRVRT